MFFSLSQIESKLKCASCQKRFAIPNNLPCGEIICETCSDRIIKSLKRYETEFTCPLCDDIHSLSKKRKFPTNKLAMEMLQQQPGEVEQSLFVKQFKKKLNECQARIYEVENTFVKNGADKVKEYCQNLRLEIQLATEQRINEMHLLSDKLMSQIDQFQADCIQNLENESTKHVANVRKESLIKEIKENETKWRDYLNNYSIDENLLQEAYKTLSDLQCKTEKELTELTGLLFNNKSCEFKSNTNVASLDFLGTVCVTEKTSKQYFTKLDHSIQSLRGHSEGIYTLAALKNGELASGSFDGKIKIWNVSSCELIHTLRGHKEQIMALLPIGNNVLASGSADKTVKIWNTRTAQLVYSFNEHTARVTDLILVGSQDSYLASSSWDNTIRVWDIKHGQLVHTLAGHSKSVNRLAALNVGGHLDLASGSFDNTIRLWSTSTGSQFKVLKSHSSWIVDIISLPTTGLLVSGSDDKTIKIWNVSIKSCPLLRTLKGHTGPVTKLIGLLNGEFIASGSIDGAIKVWNVDSGQMAKNFKGHSSMILDMVPLLGGYMASASHDETIKIWNSFTGELLNELKDVALINKLAVVANGDLAIATDSKSIKIWNSNS